MDAPHHDEVMAPEVAEWLRPENSRTIVDATAGLGGTSEQILRRMPEGSTLVLFDRDTESLSIATQRLSNSPNHIIALNEDYRNLGRALAEQGITEIDGIVWDCGFSSFTLWDRGFSFAHDGLLNMSMGVGTTTTAAELLASLSERQLTDAFIEYGDEPNARTIARAIVRRRAVKPIERTFELNEIIERAVPRDRWPRRIHVCTRVYQSLRILVNDELGALRESISSALEMLRPGGRAVTICFHSGEDRVAKSEFNRFSGKCQCSPGVLDCTCGKKSIVRVLTKRPLLPSLDEQRKNARSRSAKMRVCERV